MITCCNVHRKLLVKTAPLYSVEDSAFVFSMASSLGYVPRVVHKYDGTNWSVWQKDITEVLPYVGVVDLIVKKSPRPEPASEDNVDELLEWYRKDRLDQRECSTVYQARVLCGTVGQVEGFPNYERVSEGHCLSAVEHHDAW